MVYVYLSEKSLATSFCELQYLLVLLIHGSETVLSVLQVEHALWVFGSVLEVQLHCFLAVIQLNLLEQKLLVLLGSEREEFVIKVIGADGLAGGLVVGIVVLRHVRMLKGLSDRYALLRVKH